MDHVAVFAGLGSDALFSERFIARVHADAATPIGQYLLQECHKVFLDEIFESNYDGLQRVDFSQPRSLATPRLEHRINSVIQHSFICLAQLLRYAYLEYSTKQDVSGSLSYATGLCAGSIPAVAVAASSNIVQFLEQAQHAYRLALHVGKATEKFHASLALNVSALYVEGILVSELGALISRHRQIHNEPLYISSRLSRTSFVVTGTAAQLETFSKKRLAGRKVKTTGVTRFYHNAALLGDVARSISNEYGAKKLLFPTCTDLCGAIISPANGEIVNSTTRESLLELVLSWIFLQPVQWAAVNDHLVELAHGVAHSGVSLQVGNFGPGYGALRGSKLRSTAQVRDMTFAVPTLPESNPKGVRNRAADIAIVGMAAQAPDADDVDEFWHNLEEAHNSCREIPGSRFNYLDLSEKAKGSKNGRTLATKWGNFMKAPFAFDPKFFGVSPREALSMDPQGRIMLKTAHRALESAGYSPDATPSFAKDSFACYVGAATYDYVENLRNDIDVYYTPGTHPAFLSGRISYFYRWSGPSVTINTVCSSSMTAINTAVRALKAGDCRAALVGGVNVITSPDMYIGLDRAHFLSPSGQCKTFESSADGYCRAEGCGAIVLKSLEDALAENDTIHGIIRASELNQSGNASSITHPHTPTQQRLLERLLERGEAEASEVSVVEAHGTGTQAGDPNEIKSIMGALCANRPASCPLHVTSHKAIMGHSEAASGLLATIKLCLMFQHASIPPQPPLGTLNPRITGLVEHSMTIPRKRIPWPKASSGRQRLGVVNNFGAAGSNGALLLAEPTEVGINLDSSPESGPFQLRLSAKSDATLDLLRQSVVQHLQSLHSKRDLQDVCYTLSARRIPYERQLLASGLDSVKLVQSLQQATSFATSKTPLSAVFVFSGQGSQYLGMGRDAFLRIKPFHDHVLHCHQLLQSWNRPSCMNIFMPEKEAEVDLGNKDQIQAFQVAMFVLQVGLARLWMSWGIKPTALAGHSLGEYAALVIGDALALDDGLRLVSDRASLLVQHANPGANGMLAVATGVAETGKILEESRAAFESLTISCDNAPTSCVVGGPQEALSALAQTLNRMGIKHTLLSIPFAFHTLHVSKASALLTEKAQAVKLRPLDTPTMLNAHGTVLQVGQVIPGPEYFAQHCEKTVKFTQGVKSLQALLQDANHTYWIEIGPHASTLPLVRSQVDNTSADFIPSLDKKATASESMSKMFQKLAESGYELDWRRYYEDLISKPRLVPAPGMPFQEADYYVPFEEAKIQEATAETSHRATAEEPHVPLPYRFLTKVVNQSAAAAEYSTNVQVLKEYIVGHTVCAVPLCPASVFHELAISAVTHAFSGVATQGQLLAEDVVYSKSLIFQEGSNDMIKTRVEVLEDSKFAFSVCSDNVSHCSGRIRLYKPLDLATQHERFVAETTKTLARVNASASQIMDRRTIYNRIFSRVVDYSELYQSIDSLKMSSEMDQAVATCTYPIHSQPAGSSGDFVADPVLMDTLLHVGGFLCNMAASHDQVYIGHSVEEAVLLRAHYPEKFTVVATNTLLEDGAMMVGDAIAFDSQGPVAAIRGIRFQRLALNRLTKALSMPAPFNQQRKPAQAAQPPANPPKAAPQASITDTPSAKLQESKTTKPRGSHQSAVLEVVAKSCDIAPSSIDLSASLDELGIDSLLMLEMEESFREIGNNQFTAVDFEQCLTVGDIVRLIDSANQPEATTVQEAPRYPVEPAAAMTATSKDATTDYRGAIVDIIAQACGIPASSIGLKMSLDELGIDSLLMLEMEESFREVSDNEFTAVDFEQCLSVGDIVELVNSAGQTRIVSGEPPSAPASVPQTQRSATSSAPVASVSRAVIVAIAECCRMDEAQLEGSTELDDLGIDSLMMLELENTFHDIAPNGFQSQYLKDCRTVDDLANLVAGGTQQQQHSQPITVPAPASTGLASTTKETAPARKSKVHDPTRRKRIPMDSKTEKLLIDRLGLSQQPELLQSAPEGGPEKAAIFLVHAGSGFSRPYYRLSSMLGRDIWAIHDDKLLQQHEAWDSVAHVAQTYANFVRKASKGKPVIISGWSFGGIIAYEVTKLLQREGSVPVLGLLLCDPPPPNGYTNPRVAELLQRLFAKIFGVQSTRQNALGDALHQIAASNAIRCADLLADYEPTRTGKVPKTAFLYAVDPVTTEFLAEEGDEHAPYDAWLCERENRDLALGGWFELLGKNINIIDLPGNHYNILERIHVETTSAAYIEACEWLESA